MYFLSNIFYDVGSAVQYSSNNIFDEKILLSGENTVGTYLNVTYSQTLASIALKAQVEKNTSLRVYHHYKTGFESPY